MPISTHALDLYPRDGGRRSFQYYRDSLKLEQFASNYRQRLDSIWQSVAYSDPLSLLFPKDVEINPAYYKLYLPVTFYTSALRNWYNPQWKRFDPENQVEVKPHLQVNDSVFRHYLNANRFLDERFFDLYNHHPKAIKKWDFKIASLRLHRVRREQIAEPKVNILDIFKPDEIDKPAEENAVNVKIIKPNWWRTSGNGWLQFSQLHVSDNWYKGGENNINLQIGFVYNFNYNNQQTLQQENTLEMKVGLNTVPSDTINKFQMNTDLFRLSSKLGIRAIQNLYYTVASQFSTQFFRNHAKNSRERNSSFLSPAYVSLSLGMDFKQNIKKYELSVLMSPIAYELRFVNDSRVDETLFGIERGKYSLATYGSKVESRFNWRVTSYITYNTYLYAFTNYEKVEMNWESTINIVVNKYFSTKFFYHVRFDDSVNRQPDHSYFQFYDLFSFGINYNW